MPPIKFNALLERFEKNKEKTGWTYIYIPARLAQKLTASKVSFRVKGSLDDYVIKQVALLPMGSGDFIMPINGDMRKNIKKMDGDTMAVKLEVDSSELLPDQDFLDCLAEIPAALKNYQNLSLSHKNYFIKWLETAKTIETKANRIAMAVDALSRGLKFDEMLREKKANG